MSAHGDGRLAPKSQVKRLVEAMVYERRRIPGNGYHRGGPPRGHPAEPSQPRTLASPRSGTTTRQTLFSRPPKRLFENAQQTHIPVSASENSTSYKPMTRHSRAGGHATLKVWR